jgi:hypothetical protein
LGVKLHDRFKELGWLTRDADGGDDSYDLTDKGRKGFAALHVDLDDTRKLRRRFAYACLDWSERRPHIGGALGAALLQAAIKRRWVTQDLDSRAVQVTGVGRREILTRFGVQV